MDYRCYGVKIANETAKESFNTGSMAVSCGSDRKKERAVGRESLILGLAKWGSKGLKEIMKKEKMRTENISNTED